MVSDEAGELWERFNNLRPTVAVVFDPPRVEFVHPDGSVQATVSYSDSEPWTVDEQ